MRQSKGSRLLRVGTAVLAAALGIVLATGIMPSGLGAAAAAQAAKTAPSFSGVTIDGQPVALESYHGKPLVLLFWGSW